MSTQKPVPISDCRHCDARAGSAFCARLQADEIDFFMKVKKNHVYKKDQALFYEGNTCESLFFLCSGSVKLVQSSHSGHQQILEIVSPGGWVDKGSVFSSGQHSATAQALEDTSVSVLSVRDVMCELNTVPSFALTLIASLSHEVEKGLERIRHLKSTSAIHRLAGALLELIKYHGVTTSKGILIKLLLKREELAEMIGVTQETVVRLLMCLMKDGLIQLSGKEVIILDQAALSRMIDKN